MPMKMVRKPILMTFYDLFRKGKKIDGTEYAKKTMGMIHSGSTFHGTITLDEEDMDQLNEMFEADLQPIFWISPVWDTRRDEKDVSENNDHR